MPAVGAQSRNSRQVRPPPKVPPAEKAGLHEGLGPTLCTQLCGTAIGPHLHNYYIAVVCIRLPFFC